MEFDLRELNVIAQPLFSKMEWNYSSYADLLKDTVNDLAFSDHDIYSAEVVDQKIVLPLRLSGYLDYYKDLGASQSIHSATKLAIKVASVLHRDFMFDILVVGDTSNTKDSLSDQQILLKLKKELDSDFFDRSLINKISTTKRAPDLYTAKDGYPILVGEVKDHANALEIIIIAGTTEASSPDS